MGANFRFHFRGEGDLGFELAILMDQSEIDS